MPDSDGMSNSKPRKRQELSPTVIPQIVLTDPTSVSSNIEPVRQTTTPLPLTKDLLQRKNKLDKLLDQKERRQHQDYFTSKPVTAGLGISTPNDRLSGDGSGLRSRRTSSSRISNSNRSEPEKSQQHSEWSYELDLLKSSISGSSSKDIRNKKSTTSVSGSSNRNSVSMRAYSANHRYMDKNTTDKFNQAFTRPDQHLLQQENHTKYDIIYQAVQRVVNSRGPESKEIAKLEHFDFTRQQENSCIGEPIESIKHSQLLGQQQQQQQTTPNNRHSNRFSWLSMNTASIYDGKSIDYDDSILEKKLSMIEPIPPPPPILPSATTGSSIIAPNPLQGNSLYLFSPNNPFRILVWKFIRKR